MYIFILHFSFFIFFFPLSYYCWEVVRPTTIIIHSYCLLLIFKSFVLQSPFLATPSSGQRRVVQLVYIYTWCNRITPHGHWIWIPEATGRRFCRGTFFDTIHLA